MTNEEKALCIVEAIESDIEDRSGIGNAWESIDRKTRDEIRRTWRRLVLEILQKELIA
jgi:hypothetical protein